MLRHMLDTSAKVYGEKIALVYGDKRISYAELAAQVTGISQNLHSLGVKPGDCIALVLPNSPEFVVSFYAVSSICAVILPLNPALKGEEIKYYLAESETSVIITTTKYLPLCQDIIIQSGSEIKLMVFDSNQQSISSFYGSGAATVFELGLEENQDPDCAALYQYSSGSTGRPKRVCRTQHNLLAEADNFHATVKTTSDDVIFCLVPFFHAYGFGNGVLAVIRAGATLVLLEPVFQDGIEVEMPLSARIQRILEIMKKEHVTILPAVPYIYKTLLDHGPVDPKPDLHALRLCFSAGNFLPEQTFEQFQQYYGIPIRQQYGCTEMGAITVNLEDPVDPSLTGKPLKNTEIKVFDEQNNEVTNRVGEIVIKSPALTNGYYNMPEINALAFQNGFLFTGDIGKIDDSGCLYLTGRKKVFIDTGGYKVDPMEVEDVLLTHPFVAKAVVLGIKDAAGNEFIKAVIVPRQPCQETVILRYCREKLAAFKVPRVIEFRAELPQSPLGKLLKKDLLDPAPAVFSSYSARQAVLAAPTQEQKQELLVEYLEDQLAQLFNLTRSQIDKNRPLGEYGLDSISVFELRSRLEAGLSIPFAPTLIWNYPTVSALADYLTHALEEHHIASSPAQ